MAHRLTHSWTEDRFSPRLAQTLRAHFDQVFGDPKAGKPERFVWDYWHVPDQYTLLRTPAVRFFPEPLFNTFLANLIEYGQRHLGCSGITPPWLSAYVDGCSQELHADLPHGPFAFVYSLTRNESLARHFEGGETLLLRPETLRYWEHLGGFEGVEKKELVERITPQFDRLTVFDPRLPHGVTPVRGTRDPRHSRLVIHGWFAEPRPQLFGPLPPAKAARALDSWLEKAQNFLLENGLAAPEKQGVAILKLKVAASGECSARSAKVSINTVIGGNEIEALLKLFLSREPLRFSSARGPSELTIPLHFERNRS